MGGGGGIGGVGKVIVCIVAASHQIPPSTSNILLKEMKTRVGTSMKYTDIHLFSR